MNNRHPTYRRIYPAPVYYAWAMPCVATREFNRDLGSSKIAMPRLTTRDPLKPHFLLYQLDRCLFFKATGFLNSLKVLCILIDFIRSSTIHTPRKSGLVRFNMENIQYLSNDTIHRLLISLTKEEIINFKATIEQTLEDYSAGEERRYQPDPNAVTRPNGARTLFRPFTSDSSVGAKLVVEPPTKADGKKDPLRGILILLDGSGNPTGILGAEEVTGYRTSMNVMVPFSWRKNVDNIVIFGGGMQALWHSRLILSLRGDEVKNITFISPFKDQVDTLIETISRENASHWKSNCSFNFIRAAAESQNEIEKRLLDVDCVFCTTPSQKPLFPSTYLTKRGSGSRQPFISAIGSWQSDMIELDPALLQHATFAQGGYNPLTGESKGAVLVDDRENALANSGEVVQSKLPARDLVEIGHILAMKSGRSANITRTQIEQTNRFISEGFVVYKSIGVSLTDLTAGQAVLALRQKKQHHL
ncbi:unnamed protein product [Penicillium salamii]|nr:unnamed protein product [Penicillium salamii]